MGTYVHVLNIRLTKKKVKFNDSFVSVDAAPFSHKPNRFYDDYHDKAADLRLTRAHKVTEDMQSDYIVFGDGEDGDHVYKSNKRAVWSDGSGEWSGLNYKKDCVGILRKTNSRSWHIEHIVIHEENLLRNKLAALKIELNSMYGTDQQEIDRTTAIFERVRSIRLALEKLTMQKNAIS